MILSKDDGSLEKFSVKDVTITYTNRNFYTHSFNAWKDINLNQPSCEIQRRVTENDKHPIKDLTVNAKLVYSIERYKISPKGKIKRNSLEVFIYGYKDDKTLVFQRKLHDREGEEILIAYHTLDSNENKVKTPTEIMEIYKEKIENKDNWTSSEAYDIVDVQQGKIGIAQILNDLFNNQK